MQDAFPLALAATACSICTRLSNAPRHGVQVDAVGPKPFGIRLYEGRLASHAFEIEATWHILVAMAGIGARENSKKRNHTADE